MMKVEIRLKSGYVTPVLVVNPEGGESLELHKSDCDLYFVQEGTKVILYEPVELVESATLTVVQED